LFTYSKTAAVLAVAAMLTACGGQTGSMPGQTSTTNQIVRTAGDRSLADAYHWAPKYATLPFAHAIDLADLKRQEAYGNTIPFFSGSVKSPLDGNTYQYIIAGKDPTKSDKTTFLRYVPIVLVLTFPDGTVLDPRQPGCGDTVPVANRFFRGPNFHNTELISNGVDVGKTQVNDGFQRAEFWTILKGSHYHTRLRGATTPIIVYVNAPRHSKTFAGVCSGKSHRIGTIRLNEYNLIVQNIASTYTSGAQIPVMLTYNTFFTYKGGCCIIGYHSLMQRYTGYVPYSVGTYNDPGIFNVPIEDISVWTHELGELINDPFLNNATPGWGHVGQVGGCQYNFEVGDPLTGTDFTVQYHGFTYHPQELAFFSWFYRTPSTGTGGLYSFEGTFTSPQGVCST